jgi:formate C-acetyltransferase
VPEGAEAVLVFMDEAAVRNMVSSPPNELFNLLMKNRVVPRGSIAYLQLFNFLLSVLLKKKHIKMLRKASKKERSAKIACSGSAVPAKKATYLKAGARDNGVKYLEDAYLSGYSLEDFPRLKEFLDIHFTVRPALCHERPFFSRNGSSKTALKRTPRVTPRFLNCVRPGPSVILWRKESRL